MPIGLQRKELNEESQYIATNKEANLPLPGLFFTLRVLSWWFVWRHRNRILEFEEFAEAFGLLAGDGDFGGFFVVHF